MRKISVSKKQAGLLALVLILIATNITFAVIYFTRELTLTGGVTASGQIQVYETDGATVKDTLAFKDFYAGKSETDTESFIIKNLGDVTVYVYWEIASPPTGWAVTSDRYTYTEASTTKYTLTMNKQAGGTWQPRLGSTPANTKIQLAVGGEAQLNLDLLYTGSPATTNGLSLTVRFTAEDS